jgi:hypothetical protein
LGVGNQPRRSFVSRIKDEKRNEDLDESMVCRTASLRLYWRFRCNIVADDHRSSATILQLNLNNIPF